MKNTGLKPERTSTPVASAVRFQPLCTNLMEGLEELKSMGLKPKSTVLWKVGRVEKYVVKTRKNCRDTCDFCSTIPDFLYTLMEELKSMGLKPERTAMTPVASAIRFQPFCTLLWKGWKS